MYRSKNCLSIALHLFLTLSLFYFHFLPRNVSNLTGGEDRAFYIFSRLARPRIRNAIAHESIWLDSEAVKVCFIEGRGNNKIESEMDFTEFVALAGIGSHFPHAYLAAIAVIAVMEDGTDFAKSLLPIQLAQVF